MDLPLATQVVKVRGHQMILSAPTHVLALYTHQGALYVGVFKTNLGMYNTKV